MAKKPGARAGYGASVKKKKAARKIGKAAKKVAGGMIAGAAAGAAAKKKQKTAAERGSRPVQERDTGPGGMTATGPKKRLGKAVATSRKKKKK